MERDFTMPNEVSCNKKRSVLAVVAGPWRLMQVLWLTYVYSDFDWDIDLIRYGENAAVVDEMEEQCVKSGRFRNVYNSKYSAPSSFSPFSVLCKEYIKMIVYFLAGKKKRYCKNLIERNVDKFEYDMLIVACSYSLLEGAVLNFSDEIETHVIEEGVADYLKQNSKTSFLKKIVGKFLYKLKYTNINCENSFPYYKNCIKWASSPDRLICQDWKEVRKIFDSSIVNPDYFSQEMKRFYHVDEDDSYDLIFFTAPLYEWGKEDGLPEIHEWMKMNYGEKRILVKKHPRDHEKYEWDDLNLTIKYTSVPGEVILRCFSDCEFIFAYLSTIFLSVDRDHTNYKICRFTKNVDEFYSIAIQDLLENWKIPDNNILDL